MDDKKLFSIVEKRLSKTRKSYAVDTVKKT